jgi:hypothetical protein
LRQRPCGAAHLLPTIQVGKHHAEHQRTQVSCRDSRLPRDTARWRALLSPNAIVAGVPGSCRLRRPGRSGVRLAARPLRKRHHPPQLAYWSLGHLRARQRRRGGRPGSSPSRPLAGPRSASLQSWQTGRTFFLTPPSLLPGSVPSFSPASFAPARILFAKACKKPWTRLSNHREWWNDGSTLPLSGQWPGSRRPQE